MLKYYNIISQLSERDKISVLSDIGSLSYKEYKVLGIPEIRVGSVKELDGEENIDPSYLVNSWDKKLFSDVASAAAKRMKDEGVDLVVVPGPRIKIAPDGEGISESPVLSSALSGEYLKAIFERGLSACTSGLSLSAYDTQWLDSDPNERFIYEYIVKPFKDAGKSAKYAAACTSPDIEVENYSSVNSSLTKAVINNRVAEGIAAVCSELSSNTVQYLINGGLAFKCSAAALEAALHRYKQLEKAIEHGGATLDELNSEVEQGKAISVEMIDSALDRLIDFAYAVQAKRVPPPPFEGGEGIGLKAVRDSAVLLKNTGSVLPLKKSARLGIIGDWATDGDQLTKRTERLLVGKGFGFAGAERGYDIRSERSSELIPAALKLAEKSDVILLFLGADRNAKLQRKGSTAIPANQQELLDKLAPFKSKVVAIISDTCLNDVGFADNCSAMLISNLNSKYSAQAISEIVCGEFNPSGRLANTVYLNSEEQFGARMTYKLRDGLKVGPFTGYRYYDTAGYTPGFAFGHGIGYTEFKYSELTIEGRTAVLKVKNTGKVFGTEVVQLYVGMQDSAVIRPKKELCAFEKIGLEPGEEITVRLEFELPAVYDGASDSWLEEAGKYTVYAGASSADIRLSAEISAGEDTVGSDNNQISDYIQSESNIISDDFKLEAKGKTMKKSIFNVIAGAVAFVLAIALKLYCAFTDVESLFFDLFSITIGVLGIGFFILEAVLRNKAYKQNLKEQELKNEELFKDAEAIPVEDAAGMFVEEFDTTDDDADNETASSGEDIEHAMYIDREQSFAGAANDFMTLASEKGFSFDADTVRNIFASVATSRILIVRGLDNKKFNSLMMLLGSYFETGVYIDKADPSAIGEGSLLFKTDFSGNFIKTNIFNAFMAARNASEKIHFAALTDVIPSTLPACFSAFAKYASNPIGNHSIKAEVSFADKTDKNSYSIPQNLWFVLNVAEGESVSSIPEFVSEVATVNSIDFKETAPTGQQSHFRKFSYYQMEYLAQKISSAYSIDEDLWKKIDKVEEYVSSHVSYRMGNRMCLYLEKYAFVFMACDGDSACAVDEALAAKLLPAMISLVAGKIEKNKKGFGEAFDEIFGEDSADACRKLLRAAGSDIM